MTILTFTQFLSSTVPCKQHFVAVVVFKIYFRGKKYFGCSQRKQKPSIPLILPPLQLPPLLILSLQPHLCHGDSGEGLEAFCHARLHGAECRQQLVIFPPQFLIALQATDGKQAAHVAANLHSGHACKVGREMRARSELFLGIVETFVMFVAM